MANISEYISKIRTAIYGKDVRGALADGLDAVNKETEAATALAQETEQRQTSIEKQFDDQIANMTLDDPSSAEIVAARTNVNTGESYDTIGRRLDAEHADVTAQLAQTLTNLDGRGVNVLSPPSPLVPCKGDGTDETIAFNAIFDYAFTNKKILIIPETSASYKLSKFQGREGVNVIGIGKPKIDVYNNQGTSVVPLVGLSSNSEYENIWFNCLESDLAENRADLTSRNNVKLKNCRFEGFRHISEGPNAWGLYLDKTKNVTIDNCEFENNAQSDIAIVDGCEDIKIINAKGSNLRLNFEPNEASRKVKNIYVEGGHYSTIFLLENLITDRALINISLDCEIDELRYRGANVSLNSSIVHKIRDGGFGYFMGGKLKHDGAISLSDNLIKDSKLELIGNPNGQYDWNVGYSPDNRMLERIIDNDYGRLLRLNPQNKTSFINIKHKPIKVSPDKEYLITLKSRANYPDGTTWNGSNVHFIFRDINRNNLIQDDVFFNPGKLGEISDFGTESAVIVAPTDADTLEVSIQNGRTTSAASLDIQEIKVQEIRYTKAPYNYNYTEVNRVYSDTPPSQNYSGTDNMYFKGDIIYNANPTSGSYVGWICTESGNPGTWVGFGLIQ